MRFIYPPQPFFLFELNLFLDFFNQFRLETEYSSLLEDLEMRTTDRAIELAIERKLLGKDRRRVPLTKSAMLSELNRTSDGLVYTIVPLNLLARIASTFEHTYRYNQYVTAIQSTMQELGARAVYFESEDGDRVPLRGLEDRTGNLQFIIRIVKSLSEIDSSFNRTKCEFEIGLFRRELDRNTTERRKGIVNIEWLMTVNEAANEVAVELIKTMRAQI